jgi:hypothetical protein
MPDVVHQRQRFHQFFIQSQDAGDGARDLRDLKGMSQAIAEVVRVAAGEDLGLVFEPAEGPRVDDAVAIALEVVAIRMRRLRVFSPARISAIRKPIPSRWWT